MKYIKFETATTVSGTGNQAAYVNVEYITGVEEWRKNATVIFTTGGQCFHVKGTLEDVIAKVNQ